MRTFMAVCVTWPRCCRETAATSHLLLLLIMPVLERLSAIMASPPYEETRTYVKRVKILHDRYKKALAKT